MQTKQFNKKRKMNAKEWIFFLILVTIPIIQWCVFYLGGRITSILLAFKKYNVDGTYSFVWFENFKTVFKNFVELRNWKIGLTNQLKIFLLNSVFLTPFSLIICFFIYKMAKLGKVIKIILFAPTIACLMVKVTLYQFFTEEAIPTFFQSVFHKEIPGLLTSVQTRFWTIYVFDLWCGLGSGMLIYINAMNDIPLEVVEASKLDGVSFLQEFVHITFPMIFSTFATFYVVGLTGFFAGQFNLYEFYGLYADVEIQTFGYMTFAEVFLGGEKSYPMLSALGLIISVLVIPVTFGVKKLFAKLDPMGDY